jgi:Ni/Co efflux regulator RcnB
MKVFIAAVAASALVASAVGAVGFASADPELRSGPPMAQQQHAGWGQDYGAAHHWDRGQQIGYNDWSGASPVNYRQHHLRRPPHGYAWRQTNGQYVLAAVATGVIASVILSNDR